MPHRLYPQVAERAAYRCEYCVAPEVIGPGRFEVEHIQPRARGGGDDLRNLALACSPCNKRKHAATYAFDSEADQIASVPLYNPRRDNWNEHFRIEQTDEGYEIVGLTPTGRATITRLGMNDLHAVHA